MKIIQAMTAREAEHFLVDNNWTELYGKSKTTNPDWIVRNAGGWWQFRLTRASEGEWRQLGRRVLDGSVFYIKADYDAWQASQKEPEKKTLADLVRDEVEGFGGTITSRQIKGVIAGVERYIEQRLKEVTK